MNLETNRARHLLLTAVAPPDKSDVLAPTKALYRRLFETLTRGFFWESPQGWVHGVLEKPSVKRLGFILRSDRLNLRSRDKIPLHWDLSYTPQRRHQPPRTRHM